MRIPQQQSLVRFALPHGAHWAIEVQQGKQLWRMLQSTPAAAHMADIIVVDDPDAKGLSQPGEKPYDLQDGVAIIEIDGAMTKSPTSMGGCSTVFVRRQVRAAMKDPDVRAVLLDIDSPGGSVSGTFDLADDVAACAKVKKVYAAIADSGCSAAYAVACQATKVFINPTGMVGSIGTYMAIEDSSRMYENAGITVHVISTGKFKGTGADGAPITSEQLADLQRVVDELNAHFIACVAAGRGMSEEAVTQLADGRVHVGEAAIALGLVDAVGTRDAALLELGASLVDEDEEQDADPDLPACMPSAEDATPLKVANLIGDAVYITAALGEIKDLGTDANSFEGIANALGIMDQVGDVMATGSFTPVLPTFLKEGFVPKVHDWKGNPVAMPIGIMEDGSELRIQAEFHTTQDAQDVRTIVRERMAKGLAVGLSVGFLPDPDRCAWFKSGEALWGYLTSKALTKGYDEGSIRAWKGYCRLILGIKKLFEVSIVWAPANQRSWMTSAKDFTASGGPHSGRPLAEHLDSALSAVEEIAARLGGYTAWRIDHDRPAFAADRLEQACALRAALDTVIGLAQQPAATTPDTDAQSAEAIRRRVLALRTARLAS